MKPSRDDVCRAAARWWREAVSTPHYDNGDDSLRGGATTAMALLARKDPQEENLDSFEADIARRLAGEGSTRSVLSVDYGPDLMLSEAARATGVDTTAFPWKTVMWIDFEAGTVRAAKGYRAEPRDVPVSTARASQEGGAER